MSSFPRIDQIRKIGLIMPPRGQALLGRTVRTEAALAPCLGQALLGPGEPWDLIDIDAQGAEHLGDI